MTKEELNTGIELLSTEYNKSVMKLHREYALSNNTVKIGDKVCDRLGCIIVKQIKVNICFGSSECVYIGDNLTKKGTVNIKAPTRTIYQSYLN